MDYPFGDGTSLALEPEYAEARATCPVVRVRLPFGGEAWLVTRHADVREVLTDPRFSSRETTRNPDGPRFTPQPLFPAGVMSMDPPEHTRIRSLVSKAFTGARVQALRPRITEIAEGLADAMLEHGPPADLVTMFALPLPVTVICELLGVPYADHGRFRELSDALLSTTALPPEEIFAAVKELNLYLAGLIEARRAAPRDDMLSGLIRARDQEDRLSEQELVEFSVGLLVTGHETAATQIANFTYMLARNPGQLAALRADPALIPNAVEELLRHTPLGAVSGIPRVATEDVELSGVTIKAGDSVVPSINSANHDEAVFDNPHDLDVTRESNPHIAFGHGVHFCLGAQLARAELQIAVHTLLTRFPALRISADDAALHWKKGLLIRGFSSLSVTW
ncbi:MULTISPECIES: cytochrome P450 [Actinomadura]|uniref:Cytochrome P450 n=1 Tax=Actinomadura yumaensis TaxID=111807 RepID=A0ABW2CZM1_9ACTN|nr:cytochrome P450 [Actinomadura sp. J1-007]MWK39157.1 cytochrome P450 [Actinomadura sp. J1-007]